MTGDVPGLRYELTHIGVNHVLLTLCVLAAYFIGTISPAIILGKLYGIDVRNRGSGNAGTTNVLRLIGKKAAAVTLAVDVLKGFVVVLFAKSLGGGAFALICGIAVLCGHIWPIFYELRGGKGVAAALGVLLAFDSRMGVLILGVALLVIVVTQRVSVGALAGVTLFPIFIWNAYPQYLPLSLIIAAVIWIRHRQNVGRIFRGEEPKVRFRSAPEQEAAPREGPEGRKDQ